MIETMQRVVDLIRDRFPGLSPVAGVGGVHAGLAGLRASAAEASAAAGSARASGRPGAVSGFDAVGLRRMLVEWYASDSARESVRTLLAPLERLGPRRAEEAIRTLQIYLDEQGSVIRTARRLHLHRNAVSYRIRRIFQVLDVDPADPDQRLALQLACRARLLT
jgi:DNA-binding PucR family transcriptional regulator